MALIRKHHGESASIAILTLLIDNINDFFNVVRPMNPAQIVDTSKLILQDYYFYKPEEFKLCFDRAKKGQYGKVFDRIDGSIIFEWLRLYDSERSIEFEQQRIKEKSEIQKTEVTINYDQLKELAKNRIETKKTTETPERDSFQKHIDNLFTLWHGFNESEKKSIIQDLENKNSNGCFDTEIKKLKALTK
jgi:hypothetical protein